MNILDRINKPNDIKDIDREDLPELADEIREFLVLKSYEDLTLLPQIQHLQLQK